MTQDISKIEIAQEKIYVLLARMGVQDPYLVILSFPYQNAGDEQ